MLVLSRKLGGEGIVIQLSDGKLVEIKVVDIYRDKVRLGVTAPPEVVILRQELLGDKQ